MLRNLEHSKSCYDYIYYRCIKDDKVKGHILRMSRGKATMPDKIPVDFWKSISDAGLEWLARLFNIIFRTKKILKAW